MHPKYLKIFPLLFIFILAGCSHQAHTQSSYGPVSYGNRLYSDAELDQMLAPIALYPDALLSQVLMASTYPLEVEDAAGWSRGFPGLSGAAAVDAAQHMGWDPSVTSLVAFPDLLAQMAADINWTRDLGEAYLYQEGDVIDSIQRLREHAYRAGSLRYAEHLHVYRDGGILIIEPVDIHRVYVPYYRPHRVYGRWWWPNYPPYYWDAPRGFSSSLTFYWGHGFLLSPTFFFSNFHWHDRHIVLIDHRHFRSYSSRGPGFNRFKGARRWHHNVKHRRAESFRHRDHRTVGHIRHNPNHRADRRHGLGYSPRYPAIDHRGRDGDIDIRRHRRHRDDRHFEHRRAENRDGGKTDHGEIRRHRPDRIRDRDGHRQFSAPGQRPADAARFRGGRTDSRTPSHGNHDRDRSHDPKASPPRRATVHEHRAGGLSSPRTRDFSRREDHSADRHSNRDTSPRASRNESKSGKHKSRRGDKHKTRSDDNYRGRRIGQEQ